MVELDKKTSGWFLDRLHSAFILLQEVVTAIRQKKKVYMALSDVKKAFDTVWHAGLMVNLFYKNIPLHLWHLPNN